MDNKRKLVKTGYNQCAKNYADNRDLFKNQKYLEDLANKLSAGAKILDIGCGSGVPIDKFLWEKGFKVTGIDISEEMIGLAKENLPDSDFFVKDMAGIDFTANSFDAIVSFYAIFHIPREEHLPLLKKLHPLLKRDGYLLITMGSSDWEGTEDDFHGAKMFWSHYDKDKNVELVKQAGFADTIKWYDQNSEQYSQSTKTTYSLEAIDKFVSLLPHDAKVLDAGCASGRDSAILVEKGLNVVGVDLSIGLVNVAKREHPNIIFIHCSFLELPFEKDEFDGVWAHASLVHLETDSEVRKALKEFNRVLKKDGILHLLVKAQTGKEKTAIIKDSLSKHDRFFQYFTVSEIEELITESGYKKIYIEQYRETDKNPKGRPEVEWIWLLARKI